MDSKVYAQGDVLLVPVEDIDPPVDKIVASSDGAVILAEGEHTGHRHAFYGGALMFRDDALARNVPRDLYIGHVKVAPGGALLEHGAGPSQKGDHDPIQIPGGTFIALRQREYAPRARRSTRVIVD
jgi:hypothetical protein